MFQNRTTIRDKLIYFSFVATELFRSRSLAPQKHFAPF